MPNQQIRTYLDEHHVHYTSITHPTAYTAAQTAQAAHIPGRHLAKVVMVKIDGQLAMVAIPANQSIDVKTLSDNCNGKTVELAHEYEFNQCFPDCEVGAMPPLGELYGLTVYLAESLSQQPWLAFNAGDHTELVKISVDEFLTLTHPKILKPKNGS